MWAFPVIAENIFTSDHFNVFPYEHAPGREECRVCVLCVRAVLFATVQPEMQYLRNEIGNHAVNLLDHFVVFQCLCPSMFIYNETFHVYSQVARTNLQENFNQSNFHEFNVRWRYSRGYYVTLHNVT